MKWPHFDIMAAFYYCHRVLPSAEDRTKRNETKRIAEMKRRGPSRNLVCALAFVLSLVTCNVVYIWRSRAGSSAPASSSSPSVVAESAALLAILQLQELALEEESVALAAWRHKVHVYRIVARAIPTNTTTRVRPLPRTSIEMNRFFDEVSNEERHGKAAKIAHMRALVGVQTGELNPPPEWRASPEPAASEKEKAVQLRAQNQRRFASIRERLKQKGEEQELCAGPFPAVPLHRRRQQQERQDEQAPPSTTTTTTTTAEEELPRPRLRWLHVPKSSSSFFNTFLRYGCPRLLAGLNDSDAALGGLIPSHLLPAVLTPQQLERGKRRRHPWRWNTMTLAALADVQCGGGGSSDDNGHHFKLLPGKAPLPSAPQLPLPFVASSLVGATPAEAARGQPPLRVALQDFATHAPVLDPAGVAALFRGPAQRVLSAFRFDWGLHLQGGEGDIYCGYHKGKEDDDDEEEEEEEEDATAAAAKKKKRKEKRRRAAALEAVDAVVDNEGAPWFLVGGDGAPFAAGFAALPARDRGPLCYQKWRAFIHGQKGTLTERGFAAAPGVSGCIAKMLNGCGCAARPLAPLVVEEEEEEEEEEIEEIEEIEIDSRRSGAGGAARRRRRRRASAIRAVCPPGVATLDGAFASRAARKVDHLAFVGLTDLHDASTCLFHHFFPIASAGGGGRGGEASAGAPVFGGPAPSEFSRFNVGKHRGGGKAYSLYPSDATRSSSSDRAQSGSTAPGEANGGPAAAAAAAGAAAAASPKSSSPTFREAHNSSVLGDYVDALDEVVFAAVLERFERDLDTALSAIRQRSVAMTERRMKAENRE
jgi:hypothetical protein